MRTQIYTVRTRDGITFTLEASSLTEAWQRARSLMIPRRIAQMLQDAIRHIDTVEPHRGPSHRAKPPLFGEEFFVGR